MRLKKKGVKSGSEMIWGWEKRVSIQLDSKSRKSQIAVKLWKGDSEMSFPCRFIWKTLFLLSRIGLTFFLKLQTKTVSFCLVFKNMQQASSIVMKNRILGFFCWFWINESFFRPFVCIHHSESGTYALRCINCKTRKKEKCMQYLMSIMCYLRIVNIQLFRMVLREAAKSYLADFFLLRY